MDASALSALIAVTFTREELYLVTRLAGTTMPGADLDPLNELTPDQRALLVASAERSLRARLLATVDGNGNLVVDQTVFAMMKTCGDAEASLAIVRVAADGAVDEIFGYMRKGHGVLHTKREPALNTLSLMATPHAMLDLALQLCGAAAWQPGHGAVRLPATALARLRQAAEQHDDRLAGEVLTAHGASGNAIGAIVPALTAPHDVVVFYRWTPGEAKPEELTILHAPNGTWKAWAPSGSSLMSVEPVSYQALDGGLREWLGAQAAVAG